MQAKKIKLAGLALSLALAAGAAAVPAWAYFTSYAVTDAMYPVSIRDSAVITEEYSDWTKYVRVTADADANPVYIRARAFHSDLYSVEYADPAGKWEYHADDGFWYYKDILYAGQTTEELTVFVKDVPLDVTEPTDFGVAVVYESTPVRYNADGSTYADWRKPLVHPEDLEEQNGGGTR